jgi:DOMON domain
VVLIEDEIQQESLTDQSIVQNETHTVLTYTRPLMEPVEYGEVDVSATTGNRFIWAVGNDNALENSHIYRGDDTVTFDVCLTSGTTLPPVAPISVPVTAPVTAPVAAPVAAPAAENSTSGGGITSELTTGLTTSITGNKANKTITVELTYEGAVWISWAVSPTGKMDKSLAITGSPDLGDKPMKYDMIGYSINEVPAERQTLTDAIFTQNDTHTYFKFTKLMEEGEEQPITADAENIFLWAIGPTNDVMSVHTKRGEFPWKIWYVVCLCFLFVCLFVCLFVAMISVGCLT